MFENLSSRGARCASFSIAGSCLLLFALAAKAEPVSVKVTIQNLAPANGTYLTPLWAGFHNGTFRLYTTGAPVSPSFERLVEDGNTDPISLLFRTSAAGIGGRDGVIMGPTMPGAIAPGESASITLRLDSTAPENRYFSYASMVIASNDAFVSNENPIAHPLFDTSGKLTPLEITIVGGQVLDAGSEVNDEIPANTAFFGQMVPNTGVPENGVVHTHPGFKPKGSGGILDSPKFSNADFKAPGYTVARITVAQTSAVPDKLDWTYYGNDLGGMRFVDVDQITPSNVATLAPAWIFHTNVFNNNTSFENQPIIVNGVMYISSPHDHVFALDAATGDIKSTKNTVLPTLYTLAICCGQSNRGVAVGNGKVFIGQLDANLVALNAATGAVIWKVAVDKSVDKWTETMAPLFVNGKVIIGASGGEFQKRGHVSAYDADTGKMLWRFYTTPAPGEFGNNTWAGDSWKTGGGTIWSTPSADPLLNLLYVTTGNAAPDLNGSQRAGDNLFANSIVALDLDTGQRKWHFQEIHHDLWDYDATQPPHLFTMVRGDQQIPAIGHANKNGFYFVLDRRDGRPLYDVKEISVPTGPAWQNASLTQPVPASDPLIPHSVITTPAGMKSAPIWTPPSEEPVLIQPGFEAGPQYTGSAYSPRTKFSYLQVGGYEPWIYHAIPPVVNSLGSVAGDIIPGIEHFGLIDAIDTATGKMVWQVKTPERTNTGVLAAGDLIFFGEGNGKFNAVDSRTGQNLWSYKSTQPGFGGANGSPAAYVVNGQEYIVMAFGGNNQLRSNGQPGAPGDAVVAFALPRAGQGQAAVITANPKQVDTGAIPESAMIDPVSTPPADARVIEVNTFDFGFHPENIVAFSGEKIAIHIVNTGQVPAGFAIITPKGPMALRGPVKPKEDAYIVLTVPMETATYDFFSPLGPQRFFGMTGVLRVAAPCSANTSPCTSAAGITNAANFLAGPVVPGELFTLFGVGLGPAQGVYFQMSNGKVPTSLAGTRVLFDGVAAPVLYSQANQVNAMVPFSVAGKKTTQVTVEYNGTTTAASTLSVVDGSPGLFTMNGSGKGQAVAANQDGTLNSASKPAAAGSIIRLYATGIGQTDPPLADGQFLTMDSQPLRSPAVTVLIGGISATVVKSVVPAGLIAGIVELQVEIPKGIMAGTAVPVQLSLAGMISQPTPTIAIR